MSLLAEIAQGDQSAVQQCIKTYGGLVWSIVRRYVPSATEAEDVTQEVFIDLWKSASRYDPNKASEKLFVTMIAKRRVIDRVRRVARRPDQDSAAEIPEVRSNAHESIERSAEASLVAKAFEVLQPDQLKVVQLSIVQGFTHSEISEITGIPLGTVKSHITRGLKRARAALEEGATVTGRVQ